MGVQRRLGWNPHEEPLRFYSVGTGYHNVPQDLSAPSPGEGESEEEPATTEREAALMKDLAEAQKDLSEAEHSATIMTVMVDAMMQDINFLQHQVMKRQKDEGTVWYKRYNISFDEKGFEKFAPGLRWHPTRCHRQ